MAASDSFSTYGSGLTSPITDAEVVVPHNVNEQNFVSRAIYVGVAGDVTALLASGAVVLFKSLPIGIHPIRAKRVNATATTATDMLFLR
jgi:hypothetical protein